MTHNAASSPESPSIQHLTRDLLKFRDERDWAQFHTLRNLIVSLNLEASELLELTQWKSDDDIGALVADAGAHEALRDECADIFLYLLHSRAGFDLLDAARKKMKKNAAKYPAPQLRL